jgi:release factor glutamine methyltransferase
MSASDVFVRLRDHVSQAQADAVRTMVRRRLAGEPLQYVLGAWAFRTLEVVVDRRVLVPRPETEVVVGVALAELRQLLSDPPPAGPVIALDLGTGSGVIALSLAAEAFEARVGPKAPRLEVWATDVSAPALDVMQANLALLRERDPGAADRVHAASGSWFDALPGQLRGRVHLVVSNPPYVAVRDWHALDPGVRDYEPELALVAGPTGREALDAVLAGSRQWLTDQGRVVLEIAPDHAEALVRLAHSLGYVDAEVHRDLAGRARVLVVRWTGHEPA